MLALASVSAILYPWELIRTHEDTLVSSMGIMALDYWIMLNKERSSQCELALQLLLKSFLLFSPLISTFSSTELPILLIFGYQLFYTNSMPSARLLEATTLFSLILPLASFIRANLLYSAFLLLYLLPNIPNTQELPLHSKGHSKRTLPQRNIPKII